jgi:long-chain acyl-CoA synthetase
VCVVGAKIQTGIHKGMEEVLAIVVPDYDYFSKHTKLKTSEEIEMSLHGEIQKLNETLAAYKRISKTKIRSIELPKTSTRKVKRFQVKKEMGL